MILAKGQLSNYIVFLGQEEREQQEDTYLLFQGGLGRISLFYPLSKDL